MAGTAYMLLLLVTSTVMGLHSASSVSTMYYWTNSSVKLTGLFKIDHTQGKIILAAKNSICHLSLDLQYTTSFHDATPTDSKRTHCENTIFQSPARCQNFHHILHLPTTNSILYLPDNETVSINETVLVCGSDAYQPLCFYRNRTTLEVIASYSGTNVCPHDQASITASLLSSSGNLVSGTSLNVHSDRYGVTLSQSPYMGEITVRTIENGFILFKEPEFVRFIEKGNFYYFFMRETAAEIASPSPVYSRVGRFCKNDTGVPNVAMQSGPPVMTSYLKARILCSSTLKSTGDFPYIFNDLYDVVYITNGSTLSGGEYLYAVFTSPINAPVGSAICIYSINGDNDNDISNVFSKSYYVPTGTDRWTQEDNTNPVNCGNGTDRSYSNAANNVLMFPPVNQYGQPVVQEDGLLYRKLIIDQVFAINGVKYDVFLIAATTNDGNLYFLKKTYAPDRHGNKDFTSQRVPLERGASHNGTGQTIGNIDIYRGSTSNVSVYVSTDEGLYGIALTDCSTMYPSCSECISARDPYCAYNIMTLQCEPPVLDGGVYIQDIIHGDIDMCSSLSPSPSLSLTTTDSIDLPLSTVPPFTNRPPSLSSPSETKVDITSTRSVDIKSSDDKVYITKTESIAPSIPIRTTIPTVGGVNDQSPLEEHTWTIVAGCGGLTVGVVFGCILLALIRNKDRFRWGKFLSRRNRYNFDEEKAQTYELPITKMSDFKNNAVEYSKVPQRSTTPPLSKNSVPPNKVTDSPILTKYSNTGATRKHNRSMSFGSTAPHFIPTNGTSTPTGVTMTMGSPIDNNIKRTFPVEEVIPNTHYQRYGHNVIGRQVSKEYPMISGSYNNPTYHCYHMKSNSLDLDYDLYRHN